jgi:hypothetical protein
MSASDKLKLNGIAANASLVENSSFNGRLKVNGSDISVYTHPPTHPASIIEETMSRRFVSDTEKATWNGAQLTKLTQDNGQSTQISDFNSATLPGFYHTNGIVSNNPTGATGAVYYALIVALQGTEVSQIAHNKTTGTMYIRHKTLAGAWSAWIELAKGGAPEWFVASLQNAWVTYLSNTVPAYTRDSRGFVTIRGQVKDGVLDEIVFTLPAGYRPVRSCYFVTPGFSSGPNFFRVSINDAGQVRITQPSGTNTGFVSLDGITFSTLS